MAEGGGAKTGLFRKLKEHPLYFVCGLFLAGLLYLAEFADTGIGKRFSETLFGASLDGGSQAKSEASSASPSTGAPAGLSSSRGTSAPSVAPTTFSAPAIVVSGKGSALLERKATGVEGALAGNLPSSITGVEKIAVTLSRHSGSVALQSADVTIRFVGAAGDVICAVRRINYGSDAELERQVIKMLERRYQQYGREGRC